MAANAGERHDAWKTYNVEHAFAFSAPNDSTVSHISHGPDGFDGMIEGRKFKIHFIVGCCVGLPEPFLRHGAEFQTVPGTKSRALRIDGHSAIIFVRPIRSKKLSALLIKTRDGQAGELAMLSDAVDERALTTVESIYSSVHFLNQ